MSKKLFTLIYGRSVHVAPNTKIIPASEFSTLMEAAEIKDEAKIDADAYHLEIAKECEQMKENGYQEGYAAGFKEWTEQLAKLEEEITAAHKNLEQMVLPVALKAAKKIVGKEIELAPETVVDIVMSNIKSVAQHKKIVIFVNKSDWELVERDKKRIKEMFEDLQSLSIRPREDIERGGCVIETEVGIINAQMSHRWNVLEKAFEKLIKTSPDALKG